MRSGPSTGRWRRSRAERRTGGWSGDSGLDRSEKPGRTTCEGLSLRNSGSVNWFESPLRCSMRTTRFLTAFWALAKPYWVSAQRAKGLTLLVTVVGLVLAMVWMEVQFNDWNRDFYNTFEQKDQAEFFRQLGRLALLAGTWIIMAVYRQYLQQMLQIEWRTWLTDN